MPKDTHSVDALNTEVTVARRRLDAFARDLASVVSQRRRMLKNFQDKLCDRVMGDATQGELPIEAISPDPELAKIIRNPTSNIV